MTPETMKAKQHQQVAAVGVGGEIGLDNVSTTCMCQAVGKVTFYQQIHAPYTHTQFFTGFLFYTLLLFSFVSYFLLNTGHS